MKYQLPNGIEVDTEKPLAWAVISDKDDISEIDGGTADSVICWDQDSADMLAQQANGKEYCLEEDAPDPPDHAFIVPLYPKEPK